MFLAAVGLYAGSFFLLRKQLFFTYFCESRSGSSGSRFVSIDVRFFAKNPAVNEAYYLAYWPIHQWIVPHADLEKPFSYCEEFPRKPVYLRDVRGVF